MPKSAFTFWFYIKPESQGVRFPKDAALNADLLGQGKSLARGDDHQAAADDHAVGDADLLH